MVQRGAVWMRAVETPASASCRRLACCSRSLSTRERFAAIGVEVDSRPAEAFATYLREQRAVFARIVERANIKLD